MSVWDRYRGSKKAAEASEPGSRSHRPLPPPLPPSVSPLPAAVSHLAQADASGRFRAVAGAADRIAVVDTETTGVFPSDRILEVAIVTLDLDGRIVDEFDTLIDPQRDVGPTWVHGVTAGMLMGAPTFEEACGQVAVRLHGAVVAAHNLPFDARMLAGEYRRLGIDVDLTAGLDTLTLTRSRLHIACAEFGVHLDGAHTALADARATAQLLVALADRCDGFECLPAVFPTGLPVGGRVRRRDGKSAPGTPAPYVAQLAARLHHPERDAKAAAYLDLLNRAMGDRHLDGGERAQLNELAGQLGLSAAEVAQTHHRWIKDLIETACSDGTVTAEQYDELCRAASALGVDQRLVDDRTATLRTSGRAVTLEPGMTVCFTGVPVDPHGQEVGREQLVDHARRLGLTPVSSVTKSRCQLLVAADVHSQSGKAGKARRFEIPIVDASTFLAATSGSQVAAVATDVGLREALVCRQCERAWSRPLVRGRKPDLCPDCDANQAPPTSSATSPVTPPAVREAQESATPRLDANPSGTELVVAVDDVAGTETLLCSDCGVHWQRQRVRGRKPHTCLACR